MRILIVADQALFRQGLRALLQVLRPQAVVVELATLEQALDAPLLAPELVLIKLADRGAARSAPLPALRRRYADAVLVALSAVPDAALMREALEAGAAGYIPGTIDPAGSLQALQQLLELGVYLPPALLRGGSGDSVPSALAPAERRLLLPALQDLAPAEPARLQALWARLGVGDRVQALCLLGAQGWPGLPRWREELGHDV